MAIQLLPEELVTRIAAGEVVERPASVVKEMVENAIDAGARSIRVDCVEGGRRVIRVADDGSGIPAEEVELAFAHHATSKLRSADDLSQIVTLGFRGEALASIAAVSVVTCVTRHRDEESGALLRIDNGKIVAREPIGRPPGTTMTVEHLFAKVPARLKFLKSIQTERAHIDGLLTRYALAYPHIQFTLTHDGRRSFQSLGNGNLRDVLLEVYGATAVEKMIPIGTEANEPDRPTQAIGSISVRGYAALPEYDHANRSKIVLFVNGRPVQDAKLTYAVIQAYHTLLMTGRYPLAVILIELPPADVDVNVHPAKAEVRFRDPDAVFSAVQRAVRRALLAALPVPEPPSVLVDQRLSLNTALETGAAAGNREIDRAGLGPRQSPLSGAETWERVGIARHIPSPVTSASEATANLPFHSIHPQLPALRILGQLAATYIIAEGPEGLYLIDQHAAHERVLYERLWTARELGQVAAQHLLDPVAVDVPAESARLLEAELEVLQELGFQIEPFGGNTFLVRTVPAVMAQDDIAAALREIIADLEMGDAPLQRDLEARVLRRICKRMSIKAGQVLAYPEMAALVRDLEACESPRTCPHGRPTMIQIGLSQLEREFGRTA
ncbi:MAG: DNA mismatch repair endonuclease MutL [Anaerolineae bacterium]|nr:DNA mismatch repair endonuclease MutL [Thermoflexales bacterium]MDW8406236.1 DNA mismatch repair endonuclease MutL [Anaerolineae bacterium]